MPLPPLPELLQRLTAAFPAAALELVPNPAVAAESSVRVDPAHAAEVARWLRDDPDLRLDYCSNVTGVDWPDREEKSKVKRVVEGVEKEVEETRRVPGCLEAVYHLYSMSRKHGPVVLRQRTANRGADTTVASLTPVWRSCEFQEREAYDLFGIGFAGHPDLRRLLMWDGFEGHPMRKDYVEPDDYEYEPTPHDEVLEKAKARYPAPGGVA
ncbi:MAG: NADH-quinone oxidoreductase subunit C [Verrucomicrobiota bacterium]